MAQNFRKLFPAAAALGFMLCAGCAGHRAVTSPMVGRNRAVECSGNVPVVSPRPDTCVSVAHPGVEPSGSPKPMETVSTPEPTVAGRTASLLKRRYIVTELAPDQLLVKNPGTIAGSSLFEEAIALGKIRGKLKSQKSVPSGVSEKTTLKDGTVTIPFGTSMAPSDAAAAISGVLGVNGIQRVSAVWSSPR